MYFVKDYHSFVPANGKNVKPGRNALLTSSNLRKVGKIEIGDGTSLDDNLYVRTKEELVIIKEFRELFIQES